MLILLASISLGLYGTSIGLYLNPIFPFLSVNGWGIVVLLALFGANLIGRRIAAGAQPAARHASRGGTPGAAGQPPAPATP